MSRKNYKSINKHVELLAPAGNLEKLKYAFHYGADAVYAGVPDVSLRVRINNFDRKTLEEGIEYAHKLGKKVYVTVNIYAHNRHLETVEEHLKYLAKIKPDAVIISDPGILSLAKKILPQIDIHLSTQANATNWRAVKFWFEAGVRRIILAREVTLEEIKEIRARVPKVELEHFIHGAMCMSYSGRCILSKWMNDRSANLGDCSQPCRWKYHVACNMEHEKEEQTKILSVIDEQNRFKVDLEEDMHGTYFFNSCDMNMIEHIPELMSAGLDSFKVEGRAKSVYYLSVVMRAYRQVMDAVKSGADQKEIKKIILRQRQELDALTNRGYSTGFLFGNDPGQNFSGNLISDKFQFVGEVLGEKDDLSIVKVHNALFLSDTLDVVTPSGNVKLKIKKMYDYKMQEVSEAHGGHNKNYYIKFTRKLSERDLIRKLTKR